MKTLKLFSSSARYRFLLLMLLTFFTCGNVLGTTITKNVFLESGGGSAPDGWTFTNNVATNDIDQSSYWLLDPGSPSDIIVTGSYDVSTRTSATVYVNARTYGSGTANKIKIEISYNGGSTYTQSYESSALTSSYTPYSVTLSSTLTNNVKIRLSNTGASGTGVRIQNFRLEVSYTAASYTVNWHVNNIIKRTQTDEEGTTLSSIPTPTKADCDNSKVFVGWTENPSYSHATDAPSDLITNTTGMKMPEGNTDYYAVFATTSGGVITVTAANCASGASGSTYESKAWSAEGTDGNTYEGYFKIYGNSSSSSMQFNKDYTPCFYIDTELPYPITQIKMMKASGTDRNWTPRLSSSTKQNSSSASNGTNLTAKSVTTSGATWDVDAAESYTWLYLGVAGGASYIDYIEITFGVKTDYVVSCCDALGSIDGSVSFTKTAYTITATWPTVANSNTPETGYSVQLYDNNGSGAKGAAIGAPVAITGTGSANRTCTFGAKTPVGSRLTANHQYFIGVTPTYSGDGDYCSTGTEVVGNTTTNQTYTVTYAAGGGTGTMTDSNSPYEAGDAVTVLANTFTKPGYPFASWSAVDGSSATVDVSSGSFTMPSSNVTITATWGAALVDTFKDMEHGLSDQTRSGANKTTPTCANQTPGARCGGLHYRFVGWVLSTSVNTDGTLKNDAVIVPGGQGSWNCTGATYYAVWAAEN